MPCKTVTCTEDLQGVAQVYMLDIMTICREVRVVFPLKVLNSKLCHNGKKGEQPNGVSFFAIVTLYVAVYKVKLS